MIITLGFGAFWLVAPWIVLLRTTRLEETDLSVILEYTKGVGLLNAQAACKFMEVI